MALLLQLRTRIKTNTFTNPSLFHFYSTSNSNDDDTESTVTSAGDTASTNPNSSISSYFSDVKKVLKQGQSTSPLFSPRNSSNSSFTAGGSAGPTPSKSSPLGEVHKLLKDYRRHSSDRDSMPPSSTSSNQNTLQEIYRRNVGKPGESTSTPKADLKLGKIGGSSSYNAIRESLRNIKQNIENSGSDRKVGELSSLSAYSQSSRNSAFIGSQKSSTVIGGTSALPSSIFGKELKEKEKEERSEEMKMEYLRVFKHDELGEKLGKLRPQAKGGDWFSLRELHDRLVKLRDIEEKEKEQTPKLGLSLAKDLRDAILQHQHSDDRARKRSLQGIDFLSGLGRTPSFMLQPPKEHLVEKYFHPDNMSSAEKLKIELSRIRDEFKMSESDCGSFRVQVAQLTTKIKHLSSVLHKKDKHSRKGLIAMVQKRKRLLKYLRRTDWDSYCLVISKLGLRDNPDTKY